MKRAGLVIGALFVCVMACLWWWKNQQPMPQVARKPAVPVATNIPASSNSIASAPQILPKSMSEPEPDAPVPEVVGIGVELVRPNVANGVVQIARVIPGSPADKEGLEPLLNVHRVDGVSLMGLPFSETVRLIRGPAGTKVQLELSEGLSNERFTVELTREKLTLQKQDIPDRKRDFQVP